MINFFKKSELLALVLVMFMGVSVGNAQGQLMYGDNIHLQNGWKNYTGGFLDTRGYQQEYEKTGNHLCVSTAISKNRDNSGSGTWRVVSATGKADGTPVLIGDEVHLQNSWNNYTGGFLDTKGYQKDYAKTQNLLCVSTAILKNRDNGSGTWKIISAKGKAAGATVVNNDDVHLQNSWNNYTGGFLDTRGFQSEFAKTGNHLCVSTATEKNRENSGSGTWRVEIISASKGGTVAVKPGTPNATAYGYKNIGTYSVNNQDANNFFIGTNSEGKCQVIDKTKPTSGTILSFEIRYKETMKVAVMVDSKTGKFVTADASGNISMTADEQAGSYWTITAPIQAEGVDKSWFSLKSNHPSLTNNFLRHQDYNLYAWTPTSPSNDAYFKITATWNFVTIPQPQ